MVKKCNKKEIIQKDSKVLGRSEFPSNHTDRILSRLSLDSISRDVVRDAQIDQGVLAILQPERMSRYVRVASTSKRIEYKQFPDCLDAPYIEFNSQSHTHAIVLDVDSNISLNQIRKALPVGLVPTSVVGEKISSPGDENVVFRRPHIRFNLKFSIKTDWSDLSARKKLEWLKAVADAIALKLEAVGACVDSNHPKIITKNPMSREWDCETFSPNASAEAVNTQWGLDELHSLLKLSDLYEQGQPYRWRNSKKKKIVAYGLDQNMDSIGSQGANGFIFETVRYFGYGLKQDGQAYDELLQAIYDKCANENSKLLIPVKESDLWATAKSIATFVHEKYDGNGLFTSRHNYQVGAASSFINKDDNKRQRHQVGAFYSHLTRSEAVFEKVEEAMAVIVAKGGVISCGGVAKAANVSKTTAAKYIKLIRDGYGKDDLAKKFYRAVKNNVRKTRD